MEDVKNSISELKSIGQKIRAIHSPEFYSFIGDYDLDVFLKEQLPFKIFLNEEEDATFCFVAYIKNKNGFIGWFETLESSDELFHQLDEALEWLKENDCHAVYGPVNGSTWYNYRFNISNDQPLLPGEPFQPLFYPEIWKEIGFEKTESYFSAEVPKAAYFQKMNWEEALAFAHSNNLDLHYFPESIDDDLQARFLSFYHDCFTQNPLFTPLPLDQFIYLSNKSNSIVNRKYSFYVTNEANEIIALVISYLDLVHQQYPTIEPENKLLIKTIATHPEFQKNKIGSLMINLIHSMVVDDDAYSKVYYMLMHENNATNIKGAEKFGAQAIRQYCLMKLEL